MEIAVVNFLGVDKLRGNLWDDDECKELASVIEVIFKDAYCDGEDDGDLQDLIFINLKTQKKETEPNMINQYQIIELHYRRKRYLNQPKNNKWYGCRNSGLTRVILVYYKLE